MSEAEQHLLNGLNELFIYFVTPKNSSVTSILQSLKLPKDYSKYLIEDGTLLNLRGNKRGLGKYQWIGKAPTEPMAKSLLARYNKSRLMDRLNNRKSKKESLKEVSLKLDLIMKHLQISLP